MSVPGPVFGKPPPKRPSAAQFLAMDEAPQTPTRKSTLRTSSATDAHLRIVALQIGEREAVTMIRQLCEEAQEQYHIQANLDDIQDCLSGVLVFGNLMKRVGHEKTNLEKALGVRNAAYKEMEAMKNELIAQMEQVILKLQGENLMAEDKLQEVAVKHSHRVTILTKEMNAVRVNLLEYKAENEKLKSKLEAQEKKLMSIPRLEEQYMRHARSAVRQSEVANTLNRIEFKKMEDELKSLQFWKSKAKSLEETIFKLTSQIETLDNQNRALLTRYHNAVRVQPPFQQSQPQPSQTQAQTQTQLKRQTTMTSTSATAAATTAGSSKKQRPSSAPALRRSATAASQLTLNTTTSNTNTNSNTAATTVKSPSSPPPATSAVEDVEGATTKAAGEFSAADEILKLRAELGRKDEYIARLAQRLSYARSHPLLATNGDEYIEGANNHHVGGFESSDPFPSSSPRKQTSRQQHASQDDDRDKHCHAPGLSQKERDRRILQSSNPMIGTRLEEHACMQDDIDDESSFFLAEEAALQEERVRQAVLLQQQFNARHEQRRSNVPAHVQAIRQARSFGRVIDDLVKERDAAFCESELGAGGR